MKFRKRIKRLLLTTGLVLAFGVMATGCGKKEAIPVESTQVETVAETQDPYALGNKDIAVETTEAPTVAVIDEEDGAIVGLTAEGETRYSFDKYGPLGKEVWDSIAYQWTSRGLETEEQLRIVMDATYGNMSTKEELTQDILALEQEGLSASEETQAPVPETNPSVNEVKQTPNKGDSPAQQATQESQSAKPKQEVKQETPPAPQETQPAPTESAPTEAPLQETPAPQNNGLIPGTNLPSTGDPVKDAAIVAEFEEDAKHVTQQTGSGHYSDTYEDQGKGITWN